MNNGETRNFKTYSSAQVSFFHRLLTFSPILWHHWPGLVSIGRVKQQWTRDVGPPIRGRRGRNVEKKRERIDVVSWPMSSLKVQGAKGGLLGYS